MITRVVLSERVRKQVRRLPGHVVAKLIAWSESIEVDGLEVVRRIPGFHDESLRGKRKGQRSIRLSRSYRAIYRIVDDGVEFVCVEEVSKHVY